MTFQTNSLFGIEVVTMICLAVFVAYSLFTFSVDMLRKSRELRANKERFRWQSRNHMNYLIRRIAEGPDVFLTDEEQWDLHGAIFSYKQLRH